MLRVIILTVVLLAGSPLFGRSIKDLKPNEIEITYHNMRYTAPIPIWVELDLSNKGLTSLDGVDKLYNSAVDGYRNQWPTVHSWYITSISLNLSHNKLTNVHGLEKFAMPNLEISIDLSHNLLKDIDMKRDFGVFKKLVWLNLSYNPLEKFSKPLLFGFFKNIKLNLQGTKFGSRTK